MAKFANYTGNVELIDGLIPANNQDFPLVDSHFITVQYGERLDEALRPYQLTISSPNESFDEAISNFLKYGTSIYTYDYSEELEKNVNCPFVGYHAGEDGSMSSMYFMNPYKQQLIQIDWMPDDPKLGSIKTVHSLGEGNEGAGAFSLNRNSTILELATIIAENYSASVDRGIVFIDNDSETCRAVSQGIGNIFFLKGSTNEIIHFSYTNTSDPEELLGDGTRIKLGDGVSVDDAIADHNTNTSAHADIREQINQLSSEKVNTSQLTTAVENALAEAKASGEFDGADGVGIESITHDDTAVDSNGRTVNTYDILMTNGKIFSFGVTDGKDGNDGADGAKGADGADGANGADGVTPYLRINSSTNYWEVSYNDGSSWTSLGVKATGNDGADGAKGADGADGANGADGADGVTPKLKIVDEDELYVSYDEGITWEHLGTLPKGADGADGTNGTDGTDGTDGVGIESIVKTATNGLVDTYTITLTNGSTSTFTVKNGKDGEDGVSIEANHIVKQYPVDEVFNIDVNKRYKIAKTIKNNAAWGFNIHVKYESSDELIKQQTYNITFGACLKYDEYLTFRFLEVTGVLVSDITDTQKEYEVKVIAEVNGEIKTYSAGTVTSLNTLTFSTVSVTLNNATECYLINETATGIDGVSIQSIEKTSTNGLVDTYTINLTDGSKSTFTVTNGKDYVLTDEDKAEIVSAVLANFTDVSEVAL